MSRWAKLLARMRASPGSIRFTEVEALLRYEGFYLFNQRGSHCTYHRSDGRLLTVVRPHGSHTTCHPDDIRDILKAIDQ